MSWLEDIGSAVNFPVEHLFGLVHGTPGERVSGRELLGLKEGMRGAGLGMAAEVVADPLNLLFMAPAALRLLKRAKVGKNIAKATESNELSELILKYGGMPEEAANATLARERLLTPKAGAKGSIIDEFLRAAVPEEAMGMDRASILNELPEEMLYQIALKHVAKAPAMPTEGGPMMQAIARRSAAGKQGVVDNALNKYFEIVDNALDRPHIRDRIEPYRGTSEELDMIHEQVFSNNDANQQMWSEIGDVFGESAIGGEGGHTGLRADVHVGNKIKAFQRSIVDDISNQWGNIDEFDYSDKTLSHIEDLRETMTDKLPEMGIEELTAGLVNPVRRHGQEGEMAGLLQHFDETDSPYLMHHATNVESMATLVDPQKQGYPMFSRLVTPGEDVLNSIDPGWDGRGIYGSPTYESTYGIADLTGHMDVRNPLVVPGNVEQANPGVPLQAFLTEQYRANPGRFPNITEDQLEAMQMAGRGVDDPNTSDMMALYVGDYEKYYDEVAGELAKKKSENPHEWDIELESIYEEYPDGGVAEYLHSEAMERAFGYDVPEGVEDAIQAAKEGAEELGGADYAEVLSEAHSELDPEDFEDFVAGQEVAGSFTPQVASEIVRGMGHDAVVVGDIRVPTPAALGGLDEYEKIIKSDPGYWHEISLMWPESAERYRTVGGHNELRGEFSPQEFRSQTFGQLFEAMIAPEAMQVPKMPTVYKQLIAAGVGPAVVRALAAHGRGNK